MSADDVELSTATVLIRYEWDCPECSETNLVPYGLDYDVEECESCGASVRVVEG